MKNRKQKGWLIALMMAIVLSAVPAMTPETAFGETGGDVENPDPVTVQFDKTCTSQTDGLKAGDTVTFQVVISVTGEEGEGIDDTVFSDTWDQGLELQGAPTASTGFELQTPGKEGPSTEEGEPAGSGNSMSYELCGYDTELEMYTQGMYTGDSVTITYDMKIAEGATGTLSNLARLDWTVSGEPCSATDSESLTIRTQDPPEVDPPVVDPPVVDPPVVDPPVIDPPVVDPPVVDPAPEEPVDPVVDPTPEEPVEPVVDPAPEDPVEPVVDPTPEDPVEPVVDPPAEEPEEDQPGEQEESDEQDEQDGDDESASDGSETESGANYNADSAPQTGDSMPAWLAKLAEIFMKILEWLGI